jgi:hypothetical protein
MVELWRDLTAVSICGCEPAYIPLDIFKVANSNAYPVESTICLALSWFMELCAVIGNSARHLHYLNDLQAVQLAVQDLADYLVHQVC